MLEYIMVCLDKRVWNPKSEILLVVERVLNPQPQFQVEYSWQESVNSR